MNDKKSTCADWVFLCRCLISLPIRAKVLGNNVCKHPGGVFSKQQSRLSSPYMPTTWLYFCFKAIFEGVNMNLMSNKRNINTSVYTIKMALLSEQTSKCPMMTCWTVDWVMFVGFMFSQTNGACFVSACNDGNDVKYTSFWCDLNGLN